MANRSKWMSRMDTPLLWTVREELNDTGSKFGCGMAMCGACTMHMDGRSHSLVCYARRCGQRKNITTIEGVGEKSLHPVQEAWIQHNVPQCGYCQSGQIMQAISYINSASKVDDKGIDEAMSGNICRCGTYPRIKAAIKDAAKRMGRG